MHRSRAHGLWTPKRLLHPAVKIGSSYTECRWSNRFRHKNSCTAIRARRVGEVHACEPLDVCRPHVYLLSSGYWSVLLKHGELPFLRNYISRGILKRILLLLGIPLHRRDGIQKLMYVEHPCHASNITCILPSSVVIVAQIKRNL